MSGSFNAGMIDWRARYSLRTRTLPARVSGLRWGSAESVGAVLVTFNKRHFPMIDDHVVPYPRS